MNLPYSNSTTDRLLGCLIQAPTLCLEDKYKLDKSEFKINKFHQILFISIYNLAINGYKSISIFDLNEFLKPYTAQYNVYLDNNGDSYIETIVELTDMENFDGYYNNDTIYNTIDKCYKKCKTCNASALNESNSYKGRKGFWQGRRHHQRCRRLCKKLSYSKGLCS